MKKNLTIFCEDSYQQKQRYLPQTTKNERESISPYSKTNKNFNFMKSTTCQTPQTNQNVKDSYQFKSPKYVGVIQKNVLERLKYYEQKHKVKIQTENLSTKVKEQQISIRQLKQKPQINKTSKELFEKVKKQRSLSPNILQRFQTYEFEKASITAKYDLLKSQGMQIKNTKFTCRKNMKENTKSRSPLKQCSTYFNRSKSRSAINLQKITRNPSNIGCIVQRKQIQHHENKKQSLMNKSYEKQIQNCLIPNYRDKINNQYMTQKDILCVQNKTPLRQKYQTYTNDFQQSTPISIKKNDVNSKKWKVIA